MTTLQGEVAGALLALALLIYTFWPENVFASQREKTRLDYLLERKEQLYENLRDLNFEFRAGKYPEDDYARQREGLEQEFGLNGLPRYLEYRAGKYPEEDFVTQRAQLENETAQLLAEIEHLQQA